MALLIESIAVVINLESVRRGIEGGTATLAEWVRPARLTSDGELACVSLSSVVAARRFIARMTAKGLSDRDLAVVSAKTGPHVAVNWLAFGHVPRDDGFVPVVMRQGSRLRLVVVPAGSDPRGTNTAAARLDVFEEPFQFTVMPDAV